MELPPEELARYSRHLILPQFGPKGQEALRASCAAVVGVGGLGSAAAPYLAAAGIGRLVLVEFDAVELSNLQRQVLYSTPQIGRDKLDCAQERLHALNPNVQIVKRRAQLGPRNARELLGGCHAAIDGTDNWAARYALNEGCAALGIPMIYGAVRHFAGQVSVFDAARGPCYRCLYPDPPPDEELAQAAAAGILGALPGVIGAIQAIECVKLLSGVGDLLIGRLLLYDALAMRFREVAIPRDPDCPVCSAAPLGAG